jgi:AraC-like DNA-binding protein
VLLKGEGRVEEGGRRCFLSPRNVVLSDQRRQSTEAYTSKTVCSYIGIEWDPCVHGQAFTGPFAIGQLSVGDVTRVDSAASGIDGPNPERAVAELCAVLRAAGVPLAPVNASALDCAQAEDLRTLHSAISRQFSALHEHPTIEDLATVLRWNQRRIHRRMVDLAATYQFPWQHWREAVHRARIRRALSLLGTASATTELVARLSGFRAPAALCHAFANAGLPHQGVWPTTRGTTPSRDGGRCSTSSAARARRCRLRAAYSNPGPRLRSDEVT